MSNFSDRDDNNFSNDVKTATDSIPVYSREDFEALKRCNREIYWYRCVPLSVGICGLMYFMAAKRNMKPKALHLVSGVFGSCIVSKMSYQRKCEDRIICSNSHSLFAIFLRRRRELQTGVEEPVLTADRQHLETTDPFWDPQSKDSFGYGAHEFADYKDNELNPGGADRGSDESPTYTTYEDLRARNRANQQKHKPF